MNTNLMCVRFVSFVILLQGVAAFGAISPKPSRITWKGVETFENAYTYNGRNSGVLGHANLYRAKVTINFTYVEETDTHGNSRFTSKKISWTAGGISVANGFEKTECAGSGSASVLGRENESININCRKTRYSVYWGFFPQPPGSIMPPKIVTWAELRDDCSYSEEHPLDHGFHRYSVSAAADVDAVMEVSTARNTDYWQFVPRPGEKISFSVHSNLPARFRFTLENVSHFPGFATNANVDEDFFATYGLDHDQYLDEGQYLRNHYKNDDADLIFDPQDFAGSKKYWKRPPPDMQVMETVQDASVAGVTVTAMDFAAYGHLRAEVRTKCGGWQPVRIRVGGQDRSFVTIPMDENNNLIADRMEQPNNGVTKWGYTGDAGSDQDANPTGDGTPGDGLTTFEEYRGFMVEEEPGNPWAEEHVRTDPTTKDLFVTSDDPMLARMTGVFADVSDLHVHTINNLRYVRDPITNAPVVNFTIQQSGSKQWNGKVISQATPQHGIRLINQTLEEGVDGRTEPKVGRPRDVEYVEIDRDKCLLTKLLMNHGLTDAQWSDVKKLGELQLARVVSHELGHAVNIPHHGEGNLHTMVLLNQSSCPSGSKKGSVGG
ncbi:MAG TPA: hypothetical protein VE994_06470, partial [Terriglobales bacterium]|nr:hypothetical protein [Terriglobales bacterium]